MSWDPKALALAYLEAAGRKEFDKVEALLAPDVRFAAPGVTLSTAKEVVRGMRQLSAIHVRSELRRVFVDGDDVCLIYDFITDTALGTCPAIEWVHFELGRIQAISLYYDRLPWCVMLNDLKARLGSEDASQP